MSTVGYERRCDAERTPEQDFYARYGWCLNPLQPMVELLARLAEELKWYPALEKEWEQ